MMTPTPRKKGWPLFGSNSKSPASVSRHGNSESNYQTQPPRASLDDFNGNGQLVLRNNGNDGDGEIWKRFRETGSLDEESLEKKDRAALIQHVNDVKAELYQYQYNMGLLLIERKEWTSQYDSLKVSLAEVEENLKREQSAHLIALSEAEKREESLRRALGIEKQCVADLERSLREIRSEIAEIKFTAENKLSEAHQLVASTEEKSLRADSKLHSAEALLAEVNRKQTEIEMKLQEVEDLENALRREKQSFAIERDSRETDLTREKESLIEWEKRLREGQERLMEGQRKLNQKEEQLNRQSEAAGKAEKELDDARRNIQREMSALKEEEADISLRRVSLAAREEEAFKKELIISKKEQELTDIEERLMTKQNEDIRKLNEEHQAFIDKQRIEFESELEQKKKLVDEELEQRKKSVQQIEEDLNRKEDKIAKREQQLEKRAEKLKEKEKDVDSKSKLLKEREKEIKNIEKEMEAEKRTREAERESITKEKEVLETLRVTVNEEKLEIKKEVECLGITEKERNNFEKDQKELREEIERYINLKLEVENEASKLKLEREEFEKEWDLLDERKEKINKEELEVEEERKKIEKWHTDEEKRLKEERIYHREQVEKDLETLRLEREAFERHVESDRAQLSESLRKEEADLLQKIEREGNEWKTDMELRAEEMQKQLHEKEIEFQKEKEREMQKIHEEKEIVQRDIEQMKLDRHKLEREREEIKRSREQAEKEWAEIKNDIVELQNQREKLQEQRKSLLKEKEGIISQCDQLKRLENELNIVDCDMKQFNEAHSNTQITPFEKAGPSDSKASGRLSWIQRCASKLFNQSPSPGKVSENNGQEDGNEGQNLISAEVVSGLEVEKEHTAALPENQIHGNDDEAEVVDNPSVHVKEAVVERQNLRHTRKSRPSVNFDQTNLASSDASGAMSKDKSKGKVFKRTRSIKAVVEDAKAILESSMDKEMSDGDQLKDQIDAVVEGGKSDKDVADVTKKDTENRREGSDKLSSQVGRKRGRKSRVSVEPDPEDAETQSELSIGGRKRQRRKSAVDGQNTGSGTPGSRRYNLRRHTATSSMAPQAVSTKEDDNAAESSGKDESQKMEEGSLNRVADEPQDNMSGEQPVREDGFDSLKNDERSQDIQENGGESSFNCFLEVSSLGILKSETYTVSQEDEARSENVEVVDDEEEDDKDIDEDEDDYERIGTSSFAGHKNTGHVDPIILAVEGSCTIVLKLFTYGMLELLLLQQAAGILVLFLQFFPCNLCRCVSLNRILVCSNVIRSV